MCGIYWVAITWRLGCIRTWIARSSALIQQQKKKEPKIIGVKRFPTEISKLYNRFIIFFLILILAQKNLIGTQLIYDLSFWWHSSNDHALFATSFISNISFYMDLQCSIIFILAKKPQQSQLCERESDISQNDTAKSQSHMPYFIQLTKVAQMKMTRL